MTLACQVQLLRLHIDEGVEGQTQTKTTPHPSPFLPAQTKRSAFLPQSSLHIS
jgi:hypothetical protein